MKEREIKVQHRRRWWLLKELGTMFLALFIAIAAIPIMPTIEALAETASGDQVWLMKIPGTIIATLLTGEESIDQKYIYDEIQHLGWDQNNETLSLRGNAYVGFNTADNDNNKVVGNIYLKSGSPLKILSTGKHISNVEFEVKNNTVFNLGIPKVSNWELGELTVNFNGSRYEVTDTGNPNKISFDIPKGTYVLNHDVDVDNSYTIVKKENSGSDSSCEHEIKLVSAQEPTCTEDGYEEHYECTKCHKWFGDAAGQLELDDSEIARRKKKATGHKWNKGEVIKEATYDETGIKLYTCSRCDETREETIPKKTRSYDSDSDDRSDGSNGGGSGGSRSGSVSTQSLDVNGNAVGGPDPNHQPDSGAPVSDRGGNWGNENLSWTYTKSDGNLAKSEWLNLEYNGHTYWYYFDDSTIMQTDWFNYNGATYYFVPEMDGWRGRMVTGWQQIGDKWYYFEPTVGQYQGQMYRGIMTPDGHVVGADGAWDGNGTPPVSTAGTTA